MAHHTVSLLLTVDQRMALTRPMETWRRLMADQLTALLRPRSTTWLLPTVFMVLLKPQLTLWALSMVDPLML